MTCPECGAEYRAGVMICADCDVPLVEQLPEEPPFTKLVTVLETSDQALLLVAKGILDGAGIPYCAAGERVQDLFGVGRLPSGFSVIAGPVRLQVHEEDKEEALALLAPDTSPAGEDS